MSWRCQRLAWVFVRPCIAILIGPGIAVPMAGIVWWFQWLPVCISCISIIVAMTFPIRFPVFFVL